MQKCLLKPLRSSPPACLFLKRPFSVWYWGQQVLLKTLRSWSRQKRTWVEKKQHCCPEASWRTSQWRMGSWCSMMRSWCWRSSSCCCCSPRSTGPHSRSPPRFFDFSSSRCLSRRTSIQVSPRCLAVSPMNPATWKRQGWTFNFWPLR